MRRALAILLALTGCATDTLRVRVATTLDQDTVDTLLFEASGYLGVAIEQVDRSQGAVTIDVHDATGITAGRSLISKGCRRATWAEPNSEYIAHELGHSLQLDHSCDKVKGDGNEESLPLCTDEHRKYLMHPVGTGETELTDEEQRTIAHQVRLLSICPRTP
jgi:hypothetical protein